MWLAGNPITSLPNYRTRIIQLLPQLSQLDGVTITTGERALADVGSTQVSLAMVGTVSHCEVSFLASCQAVCCSAVYPTIVGSSITGSGATECRFTHKH